MIKAMHQRIVYSSTRSHTQKKQLCGKQNAKASKQMCAPLIAYTNGNALHKMQKNKQRQRHTVRPQARNLERQ